LCPRNSRSAFRYRWSVIAGSLPRSCRPGATPAPRGLPGDRTRPLCIRCISDGFFDDDREPPYRFVGWITWSVMACLLDGFWPPLAVTFWIRRPCKWRKRRTEALAGGRRSNFRDRVSLKIKPTKRRFPKLYRRRPDRHGNFCALAPRRIAYSVPPRKHNRYERHAVRSGHRTNSRSPAPWRASEPRLYSLSYRCKRRIPFRSQISTTGRRVRI